MSASAMSGTTAVVVTAPIMDVADPDQSSAKFPPGFVMPGPATNLIA
ncbi:hypothetical protein GCM10010468_72740 [Actinocorallia longicatena]|uniref:Uncharacterized protein n=1 Tax=Actinocorallia longicatena TaxID=111803 RepID=A0ABP6QL05_9ACTN